MSTAARGESQTGPSYRIHAVAEATGVPAATLRVWERRYGIPQPGRGENGYRLYDQAEIDAVRRLKELIGGGLAPSEAARLVRQEQQAPASPPAVTLVEPLDPGGESLQRLAAELRASLLASVAALDEQRLASEARRVVHLVPPWSVFELVLGPVLREVGELWAAGRLGVAHEHLASQAIAAALRSLLDAVQPPPSAPLLLLACAPEELHDLPLFPVALEAVRCGWRSTLLGSRTPPAALSEACRQLAPRAVGISLTRLGGSEKPKVLFTGYATACAGVPWLVGGAGADKLGAVIEGCGGQVAADGVAALGPFLARCLTAAPALRP